MWSNAGGSQYLDNHHESHSSNGPHGAASFDIPEFVPGVPWQGASANKVEDDPNITPGSVARSLSVSTAVSGTYAPVNSDLKTLHSDEGRVSV